MATDWYTPPTPRAARQRRFEIVRVVFLDPEPPAKTSMSAKWDGALVILDREKKCFSLPITSDEEVAWRVADMYEKEQKRKRWYTDADINESHAFQEVPRK